MRSSTRLAQLLVSFTAILALSLTACGGGGDDGDDDVQVNPDANTQIDAQDIDAPPPWTGTLGQPCTPDAQDPLGAGDCPVGYTCLNLQGGNGTWCSKECEPMNDTCGQDLMGPGVGACVFGINFGEPIGVRNFCGIVCNDMTGGQICDDCNGMCRPTLQCNANLLDQNQQVVAQACI